MYTPINWIETQTSGRLGLMARPRGGEWLSDELHALAMRKVAWIISVITAEERTHYGLDQIEESCTAHGLHLIPFPMPQRGVPPEEDALISLVTKIIQGLREGIDIVLQGGRGQGRAAVLAVVIMQTLGFELSDTQTRLRKAARGLIVPKHPAQQVWLRNRYPTEKPIFQDS